MTNINMTSARHARVQEAVKERFEIILRPFQAGAIADILDRDKDVFVIAGTSAGKSMVYQGLSVMKKELITSVISPTVALMVDQVIVVAPIEIEYNTFLKAGRDESNFC